VRKICEYSEARTGYVDLGVINSWIQDRLRAGHGAEGVGGGKRGFWEFLQSRAGESEENGSGIDKGEVVVGSRLRKKHEKSAAKYGKLFVKTFIRIKNLRVPSI